MRCHDAARNRKRPGKVLVLFALLLPVLLGMTGLVIDGGMMLAAHRQARNAADAAALAAAKDLLAGKSLATAQATATTFVQNYNSLARATVTANVPSTGPYAGNSHYIEVVVTNPLTTLFVQILGINSSQTVKARAVAGYEAVSGDGSYLLDPTGNPGLLVSGGGKLVVNGRIVVNSQGAGYDQNGNWVDLGFPAYAVTINSGATIQATDVQVVGGVNDISKFSSLHAGDLPGPDPLINLPIPSKATIPTLDITDRGAFQANANKTYTLDPGVYSSIKISTNATVTFNPGIYIIKPAKNTANAITITGSGPIRGNGVMFYNAGSDFDPTTGAPDNTDGDTAPPYTGKANFGDVTINGSNVQLTGLIAPPGSALSDFDSMLFFQRRLNTQTVNIQGNGSSTKLNGTLYAKWANFKLAGTGNYNAQFIAGTMSVTGQSTVSVGSGSGFGKANQVFLVE